MTLHTTLIMFIGWLTIIFAPFELTGWIYKNFA